MSSAARFLLSGGPPSLSLRGSLPPLSLRLRRYLCSASSSAAGDTPGSGHPWPEWVGFVDQLKTRGYFSDEAASKWDPHHVYADVSQLKEPCLSFARDRYDLLKSLSTTDIKTVVERGCPNLLRKGVNSAKRLRAYLSLDEADVCGTCNLRGSCDKAYVVLKDSEADARTVDVVRTLLYHAVDTLVTSDGEKIAGGGREAVETAVRKLLSELVELSETPPDPSLPKPSTVRPKDKKDGSNSGKVYPDAEMKRGDWMCPSCEFMNFSKNARCLKCNEEGPKSVRTDDVEMKKGDWICSECDFVNFSRNRSCLKCKSEGPRRLDMNAVEKKKGDWNCSECNFMNFASNKTCLRCRERRPKRELNPGEWECPSCDYLNYRKNTVCLKCNCKRPLDEDEHVWRSPRQNISTRT